MRHLTTDSIIAHVERFQAGAEMAHGKDHMESCPRCFVESLEWSSLLESLRLPALQSPPEYAIRNCMAIFQRREAVSIVRQIMAAIVFDSAFTPEPYGIRGTSDARQIRLCGGDADVHLRVSGSGRRILGQIFQESNGNFVNGVRIKVLRAGEVVSTTVTSGMGEFSLNLAQGGDLNFEADLPSGLRLTSNIRIEEK